MITDCPLVFNDDAQGTLDSLGSTTSTAGL